ncbi:hypothetical protein AB0F15_11765 [Amycolatopsis sp. NPDC026612]|uniref:hypothetical protein n=1 Tax=Amycolatopsis sp. NPDC026612 TaxID=3155466 RepID=UPI0033F49458
MRVDFFQHSGADRYQPGLPALRWSEHGRVADPADLALDVGRQLLAIDVVRAEPEDLHLPQSQAGPEWHDHLSWSGQGELQPVYPGLLPRGAGAAPNWPCRLACAPESPMR